MSILLHSATYSLKQRVLRAGTWTILGFALSQVIRLGGNLITTRLLVPDMFGVMAIAQLLMVGLSLFSDFGLNQSVVQSHRGSDPLYFNTVWVAQIIRGIIIGTLALLLSLILLNSELVHLILVGSVYTDAKLPFVIIALAFTAVVSGFESTKLAIAGRNLALGRVTQIELFCQVVGLSCMIPWAFLHPSIWALVAGGLIPTFARTVLSHTHLPGQRNRFEWDSQAFREIFGFGKWVILSSILWFLASSGDRLLLGGLVSPVTLGLYATAFLLVTAFQQILVKLVAGVAFPALSEVMRERPHQLCNTYYKIRWPFDLVSLFLSGLLFVAGRLLIFGLYDHRYFAAGHVLEVLAITLVMTRYFVADQCFVAMGKPKLLAQINLVRTVALYLLIPIGFMLDRFEGALLAIAFSSFSAAPLMFYFKKRLGLFDIRKEILVLPLFLIGILSGYVLLAIVHFYSPGIE